MISSMHASSHSGEHWYMARISSLDPLAAVTMTP